MLRDKQGHSPVRSQQQATATPGLARRRGAIVGAAAAPWDALDRREGLGQTTRWSRVALGHSARRRGSQSLAPLAPAPGSSTTISCVFDQPL